MDTIIDLALHRNRKESPGSRKSEPAFREEFEKTVCCNRVHVLLIVAWDLQGEKRLEQSFGEDAREV